MQKLEINKFYKHAKKDLTINQIPNIDIKGVLSENEISFINDIDSTQGLYKAILYPHYDEEVVYNEYLPNDDGAYIFIGFEINNYDDPNSSPDFIDFNYEVIQINENIMKQENYIAQEIYLSLDQKIYIPNQYLLGQNYPNPFNPITYIEYSIPNYENIRLEILNIQGQQIKTIINEYHQPGFYQVAWTGKNDLGKPVPSGIYFYRLESMKYCLTKKLILLK